MVLRYLGIFVSVVGFLLLLVTAAGHWTDLGRYDSAAPRKWERFDPSLVESLNSFSSLLETAQERIPENANESQTMEILYAIVADRFTHKEARHTFYSNWLLYLMGKIHPTFLHIRDTEVMLKNGYSLFCGQSSYILLQMALANDIRARHVGLDGHVVMEAWYDDDWHLYDPDLEVVPVNENGRVLSVEELAQDKVLLDKYYGPHRVTHIVGSRENNTYMSYPEGALFEWKSNVLAYFEKGMEIFKFILPVLMIVVGVVLMRWSVRDGAT